MQTILGSTGQIGQELAKELHDNFTQNIRLVSRNPKKINSTDTLVSANLLDAADTINAVRGSDIAYLTAGLPMDTERWKREWPVIMSNVIKACEAEKVKLVYFDNTYMYPQTSVPHTEHTPFEPNGTKGRVRAAIAQQLLDAMAENRIEAVICRAPEFYGPGKTQSITNSLVIEPLAAGKVAKVFFRSDARRTLIYTPDASRAMALIGNTPDTFGETWHLPCDDSRPTYHEIVEMTASALQQPAKYKVLKPWVLAIASRLNPLLAEAKELLPRYRQDNIFVSDKFKQRFPKFQTTRFEEALKIIAKEHS